MQMTNAQQPAATSSRLLSPQAAAFELLEAASLAGYGSGGRAGLLPVMIGRRPAFREAEVHAVASLIRKQLESAA
ncbi:hypothetical protein [Roseateles saccharophilus]|uniref:Uncharacterized protein n=1 Tax=Roseateles saccharophilus TaxID=304 RepID=A0A4R3ULS1_ROSSA|nr:hypothetical protein [Roseateles saccharophilus]MDG0834186.1 hypothetical protein [Roseateles saccharophilus]TCU91293.1 hypothetical protein EV671_10268 [Roseateles saccharophilus]